MTCTCHALANAIADQLNEHKIDVNQKSLADILVNNNKHVGAVWPDIYDNYGQPILVMDVFNQFISMALHGSMAAFFLKL